MESYIKIVKCLEWCTDLPLIGQTRESFPFLMKSNEWHFCFELVKPAAIYESYFSVTLKIDKKNVDFQQFSVHFQVGFKREQNFNLSIVKGSFNVSDGALVWRINVKDLQLKLPSDYMTGNWIKFLFYFDNIDESLLKISKGIVKDKCVQTGSYRNVDVSEESISKDFAKLMDEGSNEDIEIKCGEQSIKVHKIVMCGRSAVFNAMLQSDMREGRSGVVEIQDIDACHIRDFIKYMYTDILPEMTFEKAVALYEAGDKYSVRSLMLRCSEYLQDNLSPENTFQCLVLADAHSDQKLKDEVIKYILKEKYYCREESFWPLISESFPKIANEVYRLSYLRDPEE